MIHVGELIDNINSFHIENPDVLNIPLDVFIISLHMNHGIPQCTEHSSIYSRYAPNVFMISFRCTEHLLVYSGYVPPFVPGY